MAGFYGRDAGRGGCTRQDIAQNPNGEEQSPISPSADSISVCKKRGLKDEERDEEVQKKRPKRKFRKSTINVRKVRKL
ncbi:hypothetical protein DVH05_007490 [Phytophthora capsici]|nr:hypothetical protein DVH05_007490 [Phytophthora capsici]